jgi:DNA-binding NtrC family response regulator
MAEKTDKKRILLVEDTISLAEVYKEYLRGEPYEILVAETGKEAYAALDGFMPDAILLDLILPDINGLEILKYIAENEIPISVVVITAHGSINTAVEAMRLGALDFLAKPFTPERLVVTLRNALEYQRLTTIVDTYKNDIDRREYYGFIGSSLSMQAVYRIIDSVSQSKATVFITGESGTGKEICAEAIHRHSPRAGKPFIAINCGAIPKDLMESEIFGHAKGSFTGAIADHDGAAKLADGGTLFLDEICEMDKSLQTKLLRFIQTESFRKVGGSKLEEVDIRIVCATNRDPHVAVAEGRFREDLFYRLHVVPIHLPPLSEREEDALDIARYFLRQYAREEGKDFTEFSPEVEAAISFYSWPGNVRQLQNVIRNIVVLNDGDEVAGDMLPPPLDAALSGPPVFGVIDKEDGPGASASAVTAGIAAGAPDSIIRPLAEVERKVIERAIAICGGNIPKAAQHLGISASTIYRKKTTWEDHEDAA